MQLRRESSLRAPQRGREAAPTFGTSTAKRGPAARPGPARKLGRCCALSRRSCASRKKLRTPASAVPCKSYALQCMQELSLLDECATGRRTALHALPSSSSALLEFGSLGFTSSRIGCRKLANRTTPIRPKIKAVELRLQMDQVNQ